MMTGTVQRLDGNWSVTHSHATAAAATKAAVATVQHVITGFLVSTDLAGATVEVKEGTTVLATIAVPVGAFGYEFPSYLELALNKLASVTCTGTAACTANIFGFTLNPL
jgi:hypothetical protein